MELCWRPDRSQRPSASEVLEVMRKTRNIHTAVGKQSNSNNNTTIGTFSSKLLTMRRGTRNDDLQAIATTRFTNAIQFTGIVPSISCVDYLRSDLSVLMPQVQAIQLAEACVRIAMEREKELPATISRLSLDEAVAVIAYTFNTDSSEQEQNLFFVLNRLLRERDAAILERLRPFLCYLLRGLAKLPVFEGVVYRGLPVDALLVIQEKYLMGHMIQWSALTSTTTEEDIAKSDDFAGLGGIVFRIRVRSGRCVAAYSAFPNEAEVILSPNAKFFVSALCELQADGYYKVELIEQADATFVF